MLFALDRTVLVVGCSTTHFYSTGCRWFHAQYPFCLFFWRFFLVVRMFSCVGDTCCWCIQYPAFFCSTLIRNHWLFLASPVLKKWWFPWFSHRCLSVKCEFSPIFFWSHSSIVLVHVLSLLVTSCYIQFECHFPRLWIGSAGWLMFFWVICHNIAHQTRTPLTYQPTEVLETAQLTYAEVSIL